MSQSIFEDLRLADIHHDVFRNIISIRQSQNLFDDLSDNAGAWEAAHEQVEQTKPLTHQSASPIIARPFEDAAYHSVIDYPFSNWSYSRYSRGNYGVWYGADTLETTVHETAYHWRYGFLRDAGLEQIEGVIVERRIHLVRCDAALIDFREKVAVHPELVDPVNYEATQAIGQRISHDGHPGLISKSARCSGDVVAAFTPKILSNPRHFCYLTYTLTGGKVKVERQRGEVSFVID